MPAALLLVAALLLLSCCGASKDPADKLLEKLEKLANLTRIGDKLRTVEVFERVSSKTALPANKLAWCVQC